MIDSGLGFPLLLTLGLLGAGGSEADPERADFFEKSIRPILDGRCGACHGARAREAAGGLRLDSAPGVRRGGSRGPAIVPGKPDESLLMHAVRRTHAELRMPPGVPLPPSEVGDLEHWIRIGAPDPRAVEPPRQIDEPKSLGSIDVESGRRFWSFLPMRDPPVPDAAPGEAASSPIDRFIDARRRAEGLAAAPPAERRVLIRRAFYDLTGLPPAPEEVEAFVADGAPDAFERLADRLLASFDYGARWGRHWLDVARYADTSGCNADVPVPPAYRYRNWVIESFNADMPYDRFIAAQIAGDLLPWSTPAERFDLIVATGYIALSRRFSSLAEEFHLTIDDTTDNLGKAMLGLSLGCARCHDHKFDPISMEDYYGLYGIFQSTRYAFPGTEIPRHSRGMIPLVGGGELERLKPYLAKIERFDLELDAVYATKLSFDIGAEQNRATELWKSRVNERDGLLKTAPDYPRAYGVAEGEASDACLQVKGDPKHLGAPVPRGFPAALGGMKVPAEEKGSGRRQLARWLTDPANPLTARVMANRIWQHHFGHGLVRTPDDFGSRGERPTHPELLDWLAARFIESGWSLKAMHRLVLSSDAYRMSSREDAGALARDPENRGLWRFSPRRLSAEELRDSLLEAGGDLDRSMGQEHPFKPEWEWRYTQHNPFVDDFPTRRRSVFLLQQRIRQQPYLGLFDGADANAATGKRGASATPGQALFLMNNAFAHEQAARFAERVRREAATTPERIDRAYRLALGRPARADEIADGAEYLARCSEALVSAAAAGGEVPRAAWASYLRVLLSSNEFVFLD